MLITEHQVNECNSAIRLDAGEREVSLSRASHDYRMYWPERDGQQGYLRIHFQLGPIAEVGTNGITNEVLLAILIDRLRGFQTGPFACPENDVALLHLMGARDAMFERTQARAARGVEGTHTP